MKKILILTITVTIIFIIVLLSNCIAAAGSTTPQADTSLAIVGTMNLGGTGSDAKSGSFLAVLSNTPQVSSRATEDVIYDLDETKSKLVCDDFTFNLHGQYNKTTKQFTASARGNIALTISMTFSISATYDSATGAVTDGSAGLSINVGGTITTFSGALVASGTSTGTLDKVKNYSGQYYMKDLSGTDYTTYKFNSTEYSVAKGSLIQYAWGQFTITIDENNNVKGTSWSYSGGYYGRWYLENGIYNTTTKDITGLWYSADSDPGIFTKASSDFTLRWDNTTSSYNCAIKLFQTSDSSLKFSIMKLEPVTLTGTASSGDTSPDLPIIGNWDETIDNNAPLDTIYTVNFTNETFYCTAIQQSTGLPVNIYHGVILHYEILDADHFTAIYQFCRTEAMNGGSLSTNFESHYQKMKCTKISATEYDFIISMQFQMAPGIPAYDFKDYATINGLNLDTLAADQKITGTFTAQ
jgi:hypothetical protein